MTSLERPVVDEHLGCGGGTAAQSDRGRSHENGARLYRRGRPVWPIRVEDIQESSCSCATFLRVKVFFKYNCLKTKMVSAMEKQASNTGDLV